MGRGEGAGAVVLMEPHVPVAGSRQQRRIHMPALWELHRQTRHSDTAAVCSACRSAEQAMHQAGHAIALACLNSPPKSHEFTDSLNVGWSR